jgi:hypothetical protein
MMTKIWISSCLLTTICTIRTSTSSFFSSLSSTSFFFFFFFSSFFFLLSRFSSLQSSFLSSSSSSLISSRRWSQTKHVFESRRETFSSQRDENRSWWRRENVWANEQRRRTHFHQYHAQLSASKRRFDQINAIDQITSRYLQLNERNFREISWNSRVDQIDVEQREDSFSRSNARALAASLIFEETAFCAFTQRDERRFEQKWRRSRFVQELVAKRHKTQNQFAVINHRHVIDKFTTSLSSCTQHWDVRSDYTRHDSRRRHTWK